jgi:RNA polymerase sigma-70 factor (ECF subfamily)
MSRLINNGYAEEVAAEAAFADLAVAARRGDREATTKLLGLIAPAVSRSVRLVLGAKHPDVDDVIQQTFIAFIGALGTFRVDCHPAGFASRIAVHMAISTRRHARSQRARVEGLAALVSQEPGQAATDPDLAARRRRIVRDLLDQLPEDQAETLALHLMVGHSLQEIAVATLCPVNTVKSRLRLAKGALRRRIEDELLFFDELDVAS